MRLRDLAERICIDRPGVDLVIAAIIPIVSLEPLVNAYNLQIPGIVAALQESGCKAHYANLNQVVHASELYDGVHPVGVGYDEIAAGWYPSIKSVYKNGDPVNPPAHVRSLNDDVFAYKGYWMSEYGVAAKYWGDDHYSGNTGDVSTISIRGTDVSLYGTKSPRGGIASITVDNGPETLVDYYAGTQQDQVVVYQAHALSDSSHVIKIRVMGYTNAASSDTIVTLDRLEAGASVTALLYHWCRGVAGFAHRLGAN